MQLSLDPKALQPDLLDRSLSMVVGDASFHRAIVDATPTSSPSATLEGPLLERWARTVEWSEIDVVVALGLGTGLLIDLVRSRSEARLLILEPRPGVINSVLSSRSMRHPDVAIYGDVFRLREALRLSSFFGVRVMFFAPKWAKEELVEQVEAVEEAIRDMHRMTVVNENTERHFSHEWNDLILEGLSRVVGKVPANRMQGALKGVPGVLVASGPSLDKNIDLLKELEGKAMICALNSSLAALDAAEVVPNMLATVESKDIVNMVGSSPSLSKLFFTPGMHTNSKLYDLPFKSIMPAITANNGIARWLCEVADLTALPVGGSVACLAFSILEMLGCDPIILVGQDCALSGERMYASGTKLQDLRYEDLGGAVRMMSNLPILKMRAKTEAEKTPEPQAGMTLQRLTVPAWAGDGFVNTIPQLDSYRQWFEERAHALSDTRRMINATEGGASINGFEERRLADVIAELGAFEDVDVGERMLEAEREHAPLDAFVLATQLRKEMSTCKKVRKLAQRAKKSSSRLLTLLSGRKRSNAELERELTRLEYFESSIRKLTPKAVLLDTFVGRAMQRIRRTAVREKAESTEQGTRQSLGHSQEIFDEIAAMAASLAPKLDEVAAKLEQQGRN